MADVELSSALKDLPYRIQSASLKDRKEVIHSVINVLSNPGINPTIIKGICKQIQLTLFRYKDSTSQHLVRNLIQAMLETHLEPTIKCFIPILSDISAQYKSLVVTSSICQGAVCALNWSTLVYTYTSKHNPTLLDSILKEIVEIQSILLTAIVSAANNKQIKKSFNLLNHSLSTVPNSEKPHLDQLLNLEQHKNVVILASYLAQRLSLAGKSELFANYLEQFLDTFIKNFISCKTKPAQHLIIGCYPLLAQTNATYFHNNLLPSMQKSMLRNPEIILECVGLILTGLQLDLSPYAIDIGATLITNLHSNDDQARKHAADACKCLAAKIHSSNALGDLLRKTFAVYHGSDGKLTVADHKISVLQAIGNLSNNPLTQPDQHTLLVCVCELFVKVLECEVHEKTLCHALDMLSMWCTASSSTNNLPHLLIDTFRTRMTMKTCTPHVKIAYLQCMLTIFNDTNIQQVSDLVGILCKSVDKAMGQPTQVLSVTEGLNAALLLMRLCEKRAETETACPNLWSAVLDMDRQIFVSDKFLVSANSDESLLNVMKLCARILTHHWERINAKCPAPIYRALLNCVLYSSCETRKWKLREIRAIVGDVNVGVKVSIALLNELDNYLQARDGKCENNNETKELSSHVYVELLTNLCSADGMCAEDVERVLIEAILPAHHPILLSVSADLWLKIVKHFRVKPKDFVAQCGDILRQRFIENYRISPAYENALATLVSINADVILPKLINTFIVQLENPKICHISKDDYFTFLTPDGELYDKSVLPGDENSAEMNLKRESKVYSYKEQLEEQQLRRELDEKRKKEGKLKQPQYTVKQMEAIKNQKIKEQAIREKLSILNACVRKCVSMLNGALNGNPRQLSIYFKDILPVILQNLQSPMAAPPLSQLYLDLRVAVFPNHLATLGELIAHVTLRLSRPQCDLNRNWTEEAINKAMVRTVKLIHDRTVIKQQHMADTFEAILTVPAFCYIFPLLKYSLTSIYARNHDDLIHDGLHVISRHVKYRGRVENGMKDLYHPQYLPTRQIFTLLIEIISATSGRVQSQSVACLLEVAAAVSGDVGCAKATTSEIDVLLAALQSPIVVVRDAALRSLTIIVASLNDIEESEYKLKINKRIWIVKFDENEENRILAEKLWNLANLDFPASRSTELLTDIEHPVECVQLATSHAMAAILKANPNQVERTLNNLLHLYKERLEMMPAKLDEFGREVEQAVDTWFPRRGVALALAQLSPLITPHLIGPLVEFFVHTSLSDRNADVRKEMLNAALKIVDLHGKETVATLWPIFDDFMGKSSKSAHYDAVKQAVVILMGSLARHLDRDDARIKPIVNRLIQALSTPSQTVQEAVANCLPPLIVSVKEEAPGYVNKLLHQLLKGDKYGERKGAAYGLAGLVKGMGILALKQHDIMTKLTDAIQDKKNYKHREGALFAFEMLFQMLGKLFEPYIVHVLPHLLQCFGDTSQYVRTAADDTAKIVMSKLSGHGVKLVLPSLLDALEEDSWRTKTGSVELLGAMAYCAPKQLSSCLPSIVPKLIEVLSDSHMKVQEAGADALKVIGSVIRNPEIQAIVPVLLKALQDPSNKTSICLQTLLDTQFVHFIDAPSLALIMPVVQRAFMDRSTETRKMAAQIIGNMYSLTDQKDLMPYLPTIIPGLKMSLLDPVPEVRSVSARALGAMVRGMGESSFEDLLPWLMQTLTSETSSVDRSGAAQGLSEVVGGLGVEKLHKLMPEIISTAERTDIAAHVKDGYIMMFIYMPVVFTNEFTPYIGQIIQPILKALADENEYVRETALKAGQRIVTLYADSAILLLLPELEKGLFDDNWRIRYSSVQLLGDLLYRISGVTGKMSTETACEDDNFGTEQSHQAIIKSLGAERRNRVLAGLYMGRSDVALMVRQSALHVWKVVVTNTPRTLREILPTLFSLLLGCLASDSYDKRQVAARTLGDLVRKLGERVLPEIIPILERGLQSDQPEQRQGVCIGLSEIMASTSRDMVLTFVHSLVPTVRKALCDPLPEVRQAAAKTFDSLHATVGARALDDILPTLLQQLNNDNADMVEWTLDGLRQVMAIKSRVVLPYLVPQLTVAPANTRALSILASVAGEALNKYLPRILPALQCALASSRGTPEEPQQLEYCQTVVLSVVDDIGVRTIIDTMLENTKNPVADQRRAAVTLLCVFCANTKAQYTVHIPQLLRGLIHLCTDTDRDVLQMCWEALMAITRQLDAKQLPMYVSDVRASVRYAMGDMKTDDELPGFCLPKGIAPILPIFREAILNGDGDEKEAAAQGLGEVIRVTCADALQPSVVAITGPLIRILGDRFSANVKTAVLETLAILLAKVGVMLKQFLPQLQTTFVKALNDPTRTVRLKSAHALSYLIVIHQRVDPLFIELHNTIRNTEEVAIRETTLQALRGIITPAGEKMSEPVMRQIHGTLVVYLGSAEETVRRCAAGCLGALCRCLPVDLLECTLNEQLLCDDNTNGNLREARGAALSVALKESPQTLWTGQYRNRVVDMLLGQLTANSVPVTLVAIRSCGYLLQYLMRTEQQLPANLLTPFVRTMNNTHNDPKQLLARVCINLAKIVPYEKMAGDLLRLLLPTLVNGTKEKNMCVKANSELALIAVLRLREGDAVYQKCLSMLDLGARESLADVVSKVLRKMLHQPEGKEEDLDDTLLT